MIKKLVIVRSARVFPDVLGNFAGFVEGEPIKVAPVAWGEEAPLSHWGWVLAGMKLADLEALRLWDDRFGHSTVLSLGDSKKQISVSDALASVGLQIHPNA